MGARERLREFCVSGAMLVEVSRFDVEAVLDELAKAEQTIADMTTAQHAYVRNGAHDTEKAAAREVKVRSGDQRHRVLQSLAKSPKADWELGRELGLEVQTISPRRGECVNMGHVEKTTMRVETPQNSSAIVWRITEQGREALRILDAEGE